MDHRNSRRAVMLLSGGIDSSTTLAIAKSEGYEIYALSFDYCQRHRRELESAGMVAEAIGVKKHLIISFDLSEIGGSALTSDAEVPKTDAEEAGQKDRDVAAGSSDLPVTRPEIPVTYVPARNTIFLSFALAWAEVLNAQDIFIGANAVDYSGYPDCRPGYLKAFEEMANLATKASVEGKLTFRVKAPLLFMTKAEIIGKGIGLGLDYSLTWSCYDPQEGTDESPVMREELNKKILHPAPITHNNYVPCRRCDSCRFREKGFIEAGIRDPLMFG
jgi:7-cyano-7-deazaguanine synthase